MAAHHKHVEQVLQNHRLLDLDRYMVQRFLPRLPLPDRGRDTGRDARVEGRPHKGGLFDERGLMVIYRRVN